MMTLEEADEGYLLAVENAVRLVTASQEAGGRPGALVVMCATAIGLAMALSSGLEFKKEDEKMVLDTIRLAMRQVRDGRIAVAPLHKRTVN